MKDNTICSAVQIQLQETLIARNTAFEDIARYREQMLSAESAVRSARNILSRLDDALVEARDILAECERRDQRGGRSGYEGTRCALAVTGLVRKIFDQHAVVREAKAKVEHARSEYNDAKKRRRNADQREVRVHRDAELNGCTWLL